MPIYEYRCSSCGHELEALQKFSDAPLVECPACKNDALVKQVSAAGFHLKGTGWYATDFKGGGSKPAAKADGADAKPDAKQAADGTSPADAKPAADAGAATKVGTGTEAKSGAAAPAAGTGAPPASP